MAELVLRLTDVMTGEEKDIELRQAIVDRTGLMCRVSPGDLSRLVARGYIKRTPTGVEIPPAVRMMLQVSNGEEIFGKD